MKKGIFHIKLMNRPMTRDSNAKNKPDSRRLNHRTESLIIVLWTLSQASGTTARRGSRSRRLQVLVAKLAELFSLFSEFVSKIHFVRELLRALCFIKRRLEIV